jgi:FKBP-type peptidyl-prolyl cis-trans isomerase
MRTRTIGVLFSSLVLAASACNDDADDEPAEAPTARRLIQQVPPPLDLKEPPKDAMKTASGLIYRKVTARHAGEAAKRGDTVMVRYTGWRQGTGETFFTTRGSADALGIDVAYAAPRFGEALQQLRKGEKAVLWMPPGEGTSETLVYEVEVVDIKSTTAVASRASDNN